MYIEFKIPIYLSQNRNLKFNVHKSSCLACIDVLSSIVNHHPYYFLFTNFDPYSTCLNIYKFFCPPSVHIYTKQVTKVTGREYQRVSLLASYKDSVLPYFVHNHFGDFHSIASNRIKVQHLLLTSLGILL